MVPALPNEIWRLILNNLRGPNVERSWVARTSKDRAKEREPLRVMTQVNRRIRRLAMAEMWRHVTLHVKDSVDVFELRELADELLPSALDDTRPCKKRKTMYEEESDGLTLPMQHIETLSVRIVGHPWLRSPQPFPVSMTDSVPDLHDSCIARQGSLRNKPVIHLVRAITRALARCPRLSQVNWDGWLLPDPQLFSNLMQSTSIRGMSITLPGLIWLETDRNWPQALAEADMMCLGIKHRRAFALEQVALQVDPLFHFASHQSQYRSDDQAGKGVKWLTDLRFTRTVSLAAPELLFKRWMLPIWAQLERLHWSLPYFAPPPEPTYTLRRRTRALRRATECKELLSAAQVFPALLDADTRIAHIIAHTPERSESVATAIFRLIHREPQLGPWVEWFPQWSDEPADDHMRDYHAHTKSILGQVAKVLIDRADWARPPRKVQETDRPSGSVSKE